MANVLPAALQSDHWRRLVVADGLPPAWVRVIAQDAQGFMWFGTEEGLVRYDGNELRIFLPDPSQPQSLSHEAITTLRVDARNRLWIGTERGLDRWDPVTESFVRVLETTKVARSRNSGILAILPNADGSLWLGDFDGGLLRYDPDKGSLLPLDQALEAAGFRGHGSPKALFTDSQGCLWIGTRQAGLAHYSPTTRAITWWRPDPKNSTESCGPVVHAIVEDPAGRIWVASDHGLCVINPERTRLEGVPLPDFDPGRSEITNLALGRQGGIWIGHVGVRLLDPSTRALTTFHSSELDPNSPVTNWVTSLFENANGDLWVGHGPSGVSFLDRTDSGFSSYQRRSDTSATLSHRSASSFLETTDGTWWIGTGGGGLNRHTPGTKEWTHFVYDPNDATSIASNSVLSLIQDEQGTLWVGTWNGGISRFDSATGKFRRYNLSVDPKKDFAANRVWRFLIDSQRRFWVATVVGPRRYDPSTDSFVAVSLPLQSGDTGPKVCGTFVEGADGTIWTNRAGMLYRLRRGKTEWEWTGFNASSILWDIAEDRSGKLWLASSRNGLFHYDPVTGQSKNYRMADGLPHNSVLSVVVDANYFIWMGTAKGLCRLDPATDRVQLFDQDTLLHSGSFNRGARWRRSNGDLVFGTYDGFTIVQPTMISKPTTSPPPVLLTELSLSNRIVRPGEKDSPLSTSITETAKITVPSATASIGFKFSQLSYRMPERVRYEYQLEGLDPTWRSSGSERSATYTNLKPGTYHFRVRAGHLGDGLQRSEASVLLVVTPAWWERTSVRSAGLLAIIALALTVGWRVAASRNRARLREIQHQHALTVERHAADMKARDLEDRLTQAQKMESVGRLAGGVAHDFNNMLQVILGNAALALQDLQPEHPVYASLQEIENSGHRSAALTRQLLAFARQQTIAPTVLDMNVTVVGMLNMLRRLIGENIELAWAPGENLWSVRMDPSQIDQILANLCVNGRDAIEGVGKIMIKTSNVTLDDTYVAAHPEVVPGDYVLITVSDTGKGMDAKTRAHLFEPFFTTKEPGKGTGLGLATVFGIVKQNHGVISVYSELGHGATFKIYLPRSEVAALATPLAAQNSRVRGTETVLLVEDEGQILNLGRRILEQNGYTVLAAATPQAALALAAQASAPIHLLITDVVMPDMNGKELVERLRIGRPGLPCIFMSGYTADVIAHHGVLDEGVAFLEKPFTIESLTKKVREILAPPLEPQI